MEDWMSMSVRTQVIVVVGALCVVASTVAAAGWVESFASRSAGVIGFAVTCIAASLTVVMTAGGHALRIDRWGWLLIGVSMVLESLGGSAGAYFSLAHPSAAGVSPTEAVLTIAGYVPLVCGIGTCAYGLRRVDRPGRTIALSLGLALVVMTALSLAVAAPTTAGASMIASLQTEPIGVLGLDAMLALAPTFFCVLASLEVRSTDARAWLWVAAGFLLLTLGDALFAMLPSGQSAVLGPHWTIAVLLVTVGASLMLDGQSSAAHPATADGDAADLEAARS